MIAPKTLVICALAGLVSAQEGRPIRERALDMLHEALETQSAYKTLSRLVTAAPKRLSGSQGGADAVEWAQREMKAMGLQNVRGEEVTVPRWVRGTTCEVVAVAGDTEFPLAACALGGSVGTPENGIEARVLEVKSFGQLRALKDTPKGRIVFFNRPFDVTLRNSFMGYSRAVNQRTGGAIQAGKAGALASIVRSVTSMPSNYPHTGAMSYDDAVVKTPHAAISTVAADRLSHLLSQHGDALRLRIRMNCVTLPPVKSANVVGEIKGRTKPDEIVLIGAHLDAWDLGQGAQDDGAGVSHCLEAARLILATGRPPQRTIRVVLFANEENGLAGGQTYARVHAGELEKHILAIESDSGAGPPRNCGVSGGPEVVAALDHVTKLLRRYDLGEVKSGGGGADISPLAPAGVPLMGLHAATHRYFDVHHSAKDTLDRVHPRELSLGAAALAMVAFAVADHNSVPPRIPPR